MEDFILTGEHDGNNQCIWNNGQLQTVVPQSFEDVLKSSSDQEAFALL